MKPDVNVVLKIYLGADEGRGFQPIGIDKRMRSAFPKDYSERMSQIAKYLDFEHLPSNWTTSSLADETRVDAARLAAMYPELDDVTAYNLACRWSFNWR